MDDSFYQGGNDNYYDESRDNSIAKEKEEDEDEEANYFSSLPVGYKFRPTDEELITHYLSKKVMNHTLPKNKINDVRLYKYSPKELAGYFPD
ncbi:hypothetical protein GIB67_017457 [Kingdonia uniflora]|uniref:NAC domain-containing protein n=1 Tax=Kingdonia uniflora TaxID=39325 RepID=A0A7J7M4M4_9MAGN|nr:hypothetical protein GIB67_017457 [Kingdonia uniflora]